MSIRLLNTFLTQMPFKSYRVARNSTKDNEIQNTTAAEAALNGAGFDNLIRSVGGASTKRQILKLVLGGVAATLVGRVGIRPSWAVTGTCLCLGANYDPQTACCTPTGVVQKNPIADLTVCPNRTGNTTPHELDGCTDVPDSYGAVNFVNCCNGHDICYQTCKSDKSSCDSTLGTCMSTLCDQLYPVGSGAIAAIKRASCKSAAVSYEAGVNVGAGKAYTARQKMFCDCCGVEPCKQTCAGGACGALPACAGGGDCVCFTTTEGTGGCAHGSTRCAGLTSCSSSSQCPPGYGCLATTCCGTGSICAPLCSDVTPAPKAAKSTASGVTRKSELTISGYQ